MANTRSELLATLTPASEPSRPQRATGEPKRPGERWTWKLANIAGIPVRVHATFAFLLAWIAMSHIVSGHGVREIVSGVGLVLSMFACVVLHELSHALVARRFGIRTREITLLPIGGVARLERMPDKPGQELLVAMAGPLSSAAIAAALFGLHFLVAGTAQLGALNVIGGAFLPKLVSINLMLAVFNLLPAFPMDGGRVLRAALALRLDRRRATIVAASVGQLIAMLLGLYGLFTSPMLVVIALFVWMGAKGEASLVQLKSALSGLPVSQAMVTQFQVLGPAEPLSHAVQLTLSGFQRDFPVVDGEHVVGVLTHADVLKGLAERGTQASVESVMQREFETATESEMLEVAFERLNESDRRALLVMRNGQLVGLLTPENIGEMLTMESALRT